MYPLGATPTGLLDLTGNVWEWTSSLYKAYPYRADDGREDRTSEGARVVRGGSWYDDRRYARCAFRVRSIPAIYDFNLGFRVVVSLASAGF
jgi:formylglycine-generating enzyme required for sulfatase activity